MIRHATAGDIPRIVRIESQSFKDPYSPLLLMNLLSLYPTGFLLAETHQGILGYTILRIIGGKGHIIGLATDEKVRGKGVGSTLLKKALEYFKTRSAQGAWLEVRASNESALKFYEKRGFQPLRIIKGYYGDGEDALLLYHHLSP
jgi:[ribosomal protein S18]-alanine N-acetyltransferase